MSEANAATPGDFARPEAAAAQAAPKRGARRRWAMLAGLFAVLAAAGAGAWWSGALGGLLGADRHAAPATAPAPTFFELPEIIANLNVGSRRPTFLKLRAKLELAQPGDADRLRAMLPRVMDLFQTYLRETRPEELRGSIGTHRLREEMLSRANLAVAPARVVDILFVEILIQ